MRRLDFDEKGICRKSGDIFELAAEMYYSPLPFVEAWCNSDIAKALMEMHCDKISQSKLYLLHDFQAEYPLLSRDCDINNKDLMYWIGYIITYASFALNIQPKEMYKTYDIPKYMAFYDVLHTLSNERMVVELVTEYDKAKNIQEDVFGEVL